MKVILLETKIFFLVMFTYYDLGPVFYDFYIKSSAIMHVKSEQLMFYNSYSVYKEQK